jgi:hypothetical protein
MPKRLPSSSPQKAPPETPAVIVNLSRQCNAGSKYAFCGGVGGLAPKQMPSPGKNYQDKCQIFLVA